LNFNIWQLIAFVSHDLILILI